jgi:hypothetical protein
VRKPFELHTKMIGDRETMRNPPNSHDALIQIQPHS